ncbi:MAG: arabinosidase, partial [Prevotella sp.]|nr:arabinosidase [Prevotella sp.]
DGFIIVFYYVDAQHYCQLNYGCEGNTKHAIEQISGNKRKRLATHSGSIETGKWYDVKLTVTGDSIKAWLDSELMFDEVLK